MVANREDRIGEPFATDRQLQPSVSHAIQRITVRCKVTIFRQPPALLRISPKFVLVGHEIRSLLLDVPFRAEVRAQTSGVMGQRSEPQTLGRIVGDV
jgi:hypothetical protein